MACGQLGAECVDCGVEGRACDGVARACGASRCNASNCDGCCVGDKCLPGDTTIACGHGGSRCSVCAAGQRCGEVVGGGGLCEGESSCGPANCAGCCNDLGQCLTGSDATSCGRGGERCVTCASGEVCVQDSLPNERTCRAPPPCDATNCTGCCVGAHCVVATTPLACGANGQACHTCGPSESCNALGECVAGSECNPATCAGCCVGDICAVGTQRLACGAGGEVCVNCASMVPSRVCESGTCQIPTCGPATCPNGCCSGNTCVVGTQENACGAIGGGACADCTAAGKVCQDRQCRDACGPGNCSGCCLPDNSCHTTGIDNVACGQGGAQCADCTATGSFCNGLVVPRRCSDQQTTCPATYGACSDEALPVISPLQGVCSGSSLDALAAACVSGPDVASCDQAFAALSASCRSCLMPFKHRFERRAGLFACAASSVNGECREAMGCALACANESCQSCLPSAQNQCYSLVSGGQCAAYIAQASCAEGALSGGLCSPYSYADFGAWLRGVGGYFCENGPL